jgi:CHAD domain-containing protein
MKARKVKGLDPAGTLADNAERIVRVRLDELFGFMPAAADAREVVALHDMRIAAKRLRYVLEVTHPVFGPYAAKAVDVVKDLQDLLGEIHDCDVQLPEAGEVLANLVSADVAALVEAGESDPAKAPHRAAYAGLVGHAVQLKARRDLLFDQFIATWRRLQRDGFRARLEFALTERSHHLHEVG